MEFPLQDDDIGGDNSDTNATRASDLSGSKRSFGDLEENEDDNSGSKKGRLEMEEATRMILSLQESLQNSKDELASCQNELESAKSEIKNWKSACKNESFIPAGKSPEPKFLTDYIQKLKSSETSLIEQLEIAEMKLAIRDLKSELRQRNAEDRDPEVASEQGLTSACPSHHQHSVECIKNQDLQMELDRTNGIINTIKTNMEMIMRVQGIIFDPTTLQPLTWPTAGAAATDVTGPAPSAVQLDLPQPIPSEHHSTDQPRG